MTEPEQKDAFQAAAIEVLQAQRNAAMDAIVNLQGRIAVLEKRVKELEATSAAAALAPLSV